MLNALKSLKRIKLMAFLIMVQLSIGLSLLNSTSIIIDETNKKLTSFEKLFNYENTYMVNTTNEQTAEEEAKIVESGGAPDMIANHIKARYDFYNEIQGLKKQSVIENANIYYAAYNPPIPELDKVKTKNSDLSEEQQSTYTAKINVNYDFMNKYNIKISEGRDFTKEDFDIDYKTQRIPIIIGEDYAHSVKIGDEFKGTVNSGVVVPYDHSKEREIVKPMSDSKSGSETGFIENKVKSTELLIVDVVYEVIGFYDHNAIPASMTSTSVIGSLVYSDEFILIPTIKGLAYINEATCIERGGFFLEINDPNYVNYINDKYRSVLKEQGLTLEIIPIKDEFIRYKKALIKDVINSVALGGTLTLLSILGITSVLLGELNKRKREFGVRIAVGAHRKTLCKEIVLEILLLVTISTIFSLILLAAKGFLLESEGYISTNVLIVDIFIIGILTIIISIIPVMKIRKMNPIDLVRGK